MLFSLELLLLRFIYNDLSYSVVKCIFMQHDWLIYTLFQSLLKVIDLYSVIKFCALYTEVVIPRKQCII